jgi:RNA polymerase sigma-70 factor (ECF subfamily)
MNEPPTANPDALRLSFAVLRCQAGDQEAFAQLHRWFGGRTLGYLRGLLGDDAEDVQQEVWLGVYRHLADLADARAFRTWLFRVTRHRAIDQLRRQRRERELFVDAEDVALVAGPAQGDIEPPEFAVPDELLARLPPLQREAFLLRYRDDLSYAEIALVVGCSVGTVRSRLFYARQRLERLISTHGPGAPGFSIEGGAT